jgi:cell division protein FtsI (penicillin-binding protein 3)
VDVKRDIRFRVYITFTFICLFGLAIIIKAAMIQVKEGKQLRSLSNQMHLKADTVDAERGNIYSEDGLLLCSSVPEFDAYIDFTVIQKDTFNKYVDTLATCLAHLFNDQSKTAYKTALQQGFRDSVRYFPLRKKMPYYDYEALRSFPVFNKGSRRGGLITESKTKRVNPNGILAFRTIGLWRSLWKDGKLEANTIGLEATYDTVLSGVNGSRMLQKQTGGVWMPIQGTEVDPQNGRDIVTTLDFGIQDVAEHALKMVLENYECAFGTAIVMEVQTGKIRAMVNLGRDDKSGEYVENQNYALTRGEPGSTFKMATLLSLLNDGYINVNDDVNCNDGSKQFFNRTMHDSHHGLGKMPIRNAFAQSSNVGMATIAFEHYANNPKQFTEHLKKLHLNDRTGIDLRGESKPMMIEPGESEWSKTTLPWMATGYGIMITPLHTCMLYNAVANNGRMMKPYLVSAVREYGKDIKTFEPVALEEHVASEDAIKQVQSCAEEVVLSGTAKHIKSPHYRIAGKTGTAQVADKGIPYKAGVYQGSFVGYFPAEKPRYTICVVIRTKAHSRAYYGGAIAAPVFRMIADKIFATGMGSWDGQLDSIARTGNHQLFAKMATQKSYNVLLNAMNKKPGGEEAMPGAMVQMGIDSAKKMIVQHKPIYRNMVPDVKGMGLRDAVYLMEREGLHVQVIGSGMVQSQSVAAGTAIVKGQVVVLQMS